MIIGLLYKSIFHVPDVQNKNKKPLREYGKNGIIYNHRFLNNRQKQEMILANKEQIN